MLKGNAYPETVFITILGITILLASTQAFAQGYNLASILPVWHIIAVSGLSVGLHGVMLVLALGRGDLSVYYPIIRCAPLGVVAIGFVFLGQTFTPSLLFGITVVLLAVFFLQRQPGARLLSNPLTLAYALMAMLTSAVYSLADAAAAQVAPAVVVYFWQSVVALPIYVFFLWARQSYSGGPGAKQLAVHWVSRAWHHLLAGALAYSSYLLILWAYQLGGDVAPVTSVRLASIPISVLGAALLLKERSFGRRMLWACVLASGIAVVIASD